MTGQAPTAAEPGWHRFENGTCRKLTGQEVGALEAEFGQESAFAGHGDGGLRLGPGWRVVEVTRTMRVQVSADDDEMAREKGCDIGWQWFSENAHNGDQGSCTARVVQWEDHPDA